MTPETRVQQRRRFAKQRKEAIARVREQVFDAEFEAGGGAMLQRYEDAWYLLAEIDRLTSQVVRLRKKIGK